MVSLTQFPYRGGPNALMCLPTYFDVKYAINPRMAETLKNGTAVDKAKALRQSSLLANALKEFGVGLSFLPPHPNFPDMVFAANAGFCHGGMVVLSSFKHKERRGEISPVLSYFRGVLGITSCVLPPFSGDRKTPLFFEGQGDALWYKGSLMCGYGIRSNEEGFRQLFRLLPLPVSQESYFLELVDERFYHLDTCFCPLGVNLLWYPSAFSADTQKKIRGLIGSGCSIEATEDDAVNLCCNGIFLPHGEKMTLITSPVSFHLRHALASLGVDVYENDISEFLKSSGGNRCLVLFLN